MTEKNDPLLAVTPVLSQRATFTLVLGAHFAKFILL